MAHPAGGLGVWVPVRPTKTPDGLQVESQVLVVQHLYGHHKHGNYIGTQQFPPSQCKLSIITDYVHDDQFTGANGSIVSGV